MAFVEKKCISGSLNYSSGWTESCFFSIMRLSNFPGPMDGVFFFTGSIIIGVVQVEGKRYVRGVFFVLRWV